VIEDRASQKGDPPKIRLREARELMETMGADVFAGLPTWLLTVNNHFFRPKPFYVKELNEAVRRGARS
jgi:hypothetical protein